MAGFICPFCNQSMSLTNETISSRIFDFNCYHRDSPTLEKESPFAIETVYYHCPNCNEESVVVLGRGARVKGVRRWIHPTSIAKQFPEYIPESIRSDYTEAAAIIDMSPKASATLSRRCLQGMIRDFWGVVDKPNLYQEINAIEDKVSPSTWKALDATRKIGNIGAHMEHDINTIVDIEPYEAERLIKLIEFLIKEWYIDKHESEQLVKEIVEISEEKSPC